MKHDDTLVANITKSLKDFINQVDEKYELTSLEIVNALSRVFIKRHTL